MPKIKLLPQDIVSRISAGEVIERPANVIKELLENSIDSGATLIKIEIEESGFKKVSVFDNGFGMDKSDLEMCWLPHSTSKLELAEDLETISTLGFRGEALNSIFSVSEGYISSKPKGQKFGYKLDIAFGEKISIVPHSMADGTLVVVDNLFQNTPARKQFLHNKNYEYSQILEVVTYLALTRPDISFILSNNSKEVLVLPKNQSLEDRISLLLSPKFLSNLVPIDYKSEKYRFWGYISKPQLSLRTTKKQFLIVNSRAISPTLLSSPIRDFYGNLIEYRTHPAFILNFDFWNTPIDINVHPKKETIKIHSFDEILVNVKEVLTQTLQKHDLTYIKEGFDSISKILIKEPNAKYKSQIGRNQSLFTDPHFQFIQIHKMYIVVESQTGILMIDQHAAHERIIYEELLSKFKESILSSDVIETNEVLEFSVTDYENLIVYKSFFTDLGIKFEEFGRNMVKLISIPRIYEGRNMSLILLGFLEDIVSRVGVDITNSDEKTKKALSYLACRMAIKSGQDLSESEVRDLLAKLSLTSFEYTCPHGRPVKVDLPLAEIDRLFKRV